MNIANTNACCKTYLGNNISKELSDTIRYNINAIVFTKTIESIRGTGLWATTTLTIYQYLIINTKYNLI